MPELIATHPLQGHAPRSGGGATLAVLDPGPIWSVALYPGSAGGGLPSPGTWAAADGGRIAWTGVDQVLVFGPLPERLAAGRDTAVTDQSDGWAGLALAGPGAVAALARLVGIDLRPAAFPPGSAARTGLNHVPSLILRHDEGFDIFVPPSMAGTAWDELAEVLGHLEARAG